MYNLLGANCEHLARWCAESHFWSDQVANYALPMAIVSTYGFLVRSRPRRLARLGRTVAPIVIFNGVVRRLSSARWKRLLRECPGAVDSASTPAVRPGCASLNHPTHRSSRTICTRSPPFVA